MNSTKTHKDERKKSNPNSEKQLKRQQRIRKGKSFKSIEIPSKGIDSSNPDPGGERVKRKELNEHKTRRKQKPCYIRSHIQIHIGKKPKKHVFRCKKSKKPKKKEKKNLERKQKNKNKDRVIPRWVESTRIRSEEGAIAAISR